MEGNREEMACCIHLLGICLNGFYSYWKWNMIVCSRLQKPCWTVSEMSVTWTLQHPQPFLYNNFFIFFPFPPHLGFLPLVQYIQLSVVLLQPSSINVRSDPLAGVSAKGKGYSSAAYPWRRNSPNFPYCKTSNNFRSSKPLGSISLGRDFLFPVNARAIKKLSCAKQMNTFTKFRPETFTVGELKQQWALSGAPHDCKVCRGRSLGL